MKVKYTVKTNMVGSQVEAIFEIPKDLGLTEEEWNEYSESDKVEAIWEDYNAWCDNIIDGGWHEIED